MQKPPKIVYGKQNNLPFPPPGYQQPGSVGTILQDVPEEIPQLSADSPNPWQTDDPQYYDSDNPSDAEVVEESEAHHSASSDSEPHEISDAPTQVVVPSFLDLGRFEASGGFHSLSRELFETTGSHRFCKSLHEQTGTDQLYPFTVDGVVHFITQLNNSEISLQITRDRAGHVAKGLVIGIWLIVCLKAHSNTSISPSTLARKNCAVLRRTAIDLAHDPEQADASKGLLHKYLVYWERRVRNVYASTTSSMYVDWSGVVWWPSIPQLLFEDVNDDFQHKLLNLLDAKRLTEMAKYCLELDYEAGRSPLAQYEEPEKTMWRTRSMLGTMDPSLLKACICGTVAALAERGGSDVRKELLTIAEREEVTPGTYANFFTDHSGMALTPAQLRVVINNMRRYLCLKPSAADLIWIWRIDRYHYPKPDWQRQHVNQGLRRYTDWRPQDPKNPHKPFKRDDNRRKVLFHFVKEVESMIAVSEHAGRLHVPCSRPLTEVGYSKRPRHRLQHHAKHIQSNYIMSLFHTLMMDVFGKDFRLQQVILYSCWRSGQACLSEVVLTRILQAYTDGGKGLSHYQAGLSNWSANRYVGDEVWHRVIKEGDVERRLLESFEVEIEETKQRCEDLERQNLGPVPSLLQGETGEAIFEQLQALLVYLRNM